MSVIIAPTQNSISVVHTRNSIDVEATCNQVQVSVVSGQMTWFWLSPWQADVFMEPRNRLEVVPLFFGPYQMSPVTLEVMP